MNKIWCLGHQYRLGNGSCTKNKSECNTFPPMFWGMNVFVQNSVVSLKTVYIDPDTHISNSWDSASVSCSLENSRKWIYLHICEELLQYVSPILCVMGIIIPEIIECVFMGTYCLLYTHYYFT